MSLPQTPPGGGKRRARVHWVYVPTPKGKSWHAWCAGPCHWFTCHTKGRSKPCLHELTSGEIVCERCEAGEGADVLGYQPLYRETDNRPCMVIVHEYAREMVDVLKLHQRVIVGRGEGNTDSVWISQAINKQPVFQSKLVERMRPADLTETLLRVWQMPELTEWYRHTHGLPTDPPATKQVKVKPPTPTPPTTERIPFPAEKLADVLDEAAATARERAEREERTSKWLREQAAAENGDGKKKK